MIGKPVISQFFCAVAIASVTLTNTTFALAVTPEHLPVAKTAEIEQLPVAKKASTLARAMAEYTEEKEQLLLNFEKTLTLDIRELQDSTGLAYLGGEVSEVELERYLSQLKGELGKEQYITYREHQAARDHQSFHVTFVNPYEYQTINKEKLKISQKIRVTLHGLGKVEKDNKTSYFVVASSSDGQFMRQNLLLKNKNFHVTLGFYPNDVYGVGKGRDTLINK
ncbi:hypothetical protein [Cognaticolwellia mytili]|uniref:hypothetical protein n=1 Tax=Cognaticolwellia mytili TaxID=1888913 RepID=UPI000A17760C|nr:hypothetical protein [Cognaticolwellia mytili]